MLKSNNIEIFLAREELLNIFQEVIIQLKSKKLNHKSEFHISYDLEKKNLGPIIILDDQSLSKLINKSFIFNNFIFIIGNINKMSSEYLDSNFINYEFLETPFSILRLLTQCDNFLNEINNSYLEVANFNRFSYSFNLNTIYKNDFSLYLTDKENEIFKILIENIGSCLNRKQLLSKVWSYDQSIDTHTLETHIYTLRKKLKKKLGLEDLIMHQEEGYSIKS